MILDVSRPIDAGTISPYVGFRDQRRGCFPLAPPASPMVLEPGFEPTPQRKTPLALDLAGFFFLLLGYGFDLLHCGSKILDQRFHFLDRHFRPVFTVVD